MTRLQDAGGWQRGEPVLQDITEKTASVWASGIEALSQDEWGGVTNFVFLGSKITADGTTVFKLRCLLLGRKSMRNLNSILKSGDINLPTKICIVKLWFFQ